MKLKNLCFPRLLVVALLALSFNVSGQNLITYGNLDATNPLPPVGPANSDFTRNCSGNPSTYCWTNNMQNHGFGNIPTQSGVGNMLVFDGFDAGGTNRVAWSDVFNLNSGSSYTFSFIARNRFGSGAGNNVPIDIIINGSTFNRTIVANTNWQPFTVTFTGFGAGTTIGIRQRTDNPSRDFAIDDLSLVENCEFTANFSYCVDECTVCFTNKSVTSGAANFTWDFGDGATSQELNPCHTYSQSGFYEVCLSGSLCEGECSGEICIPIYVHCEGAEESGIAPGGTNNPPSNQTDDRLGLDEQATFQLQVTPNPTHDQVAVNWGDAALGEVQWKVITSNGEEVMRGSQNDRTPLELNVENLSVGTYYIIVNGQNDQQASTPFVKQ